MAITGIDTIDGKQIIAAGAVSAKSAEMAYNDENGNPITGYLTAVPTGTMNESAFGYDSDNKISSYNGSAFAGGSYQPSGNYIPYTAIEGKAFKTNSGLKIATFIGSELHTNFINNNFITLQSVNSTLGINNQVILATGSLTLKTKSDSAYVDREKIHKWDSASDYIQNNSAALNEVSAKLDTTAFSTVSGDFYTTANESGFITGAPAGTMNESAFEYDANDKISGYNGSAFAQGGGGSAPTYDYTDNGFISAIDSSGLYASSGSANRLRANGTMGANITQSDGANSFLYMPNKSPWTTAGAATGIFSPLQFATGACLAMDAGYFKAYFKGNEWFVSNTSIGQALRGEVHAARGVHISGATTAGRFFDLSTHGVRGQNSVGEWLYGPAEDAALRAVSSCDMHESAFGYDASNNITAYNGSAFKAGDEFPQSATDAINVVTGGSANWNSTTATVNANSGAWGGLGLEISAGFGIDIQMVDNKLVISLATATGDI